MKVWISSIVCLMLTSILITVYRRHNPDPAFLDWAFTTLTLAMALVGWNGFKAIEEKKYKKK